MTTTQMSNNKALPYNLMSNYLFTRVSDLEETIPLKGRHQPEIGAWCGPLEGVSLEIQKVMDGLKRKMMGVRFGVKPNARAPQEVYVFLEQSIFAMGYITYGDKTKRSEDGRMGTLSSLPNAKDFNTYNIHSHTIDHFNMTEGKQRHMKKAKHVDRAVKNALGCFRDVELSELACVMINKVKREFSTKMDSYDRPIRDTASKLAMNSYNIIRGSADLTVEFERMLKSDYVWGNMELKDNVETLIKNVNEYNLARDNPYSGYFVCMCTRGGKVTYKTLKFDNIVAALKAGFQDNVWRVEDGQCRYGTTIPLNLVLNKYDENTLPEWIKDRRAVLKMMARENTIVDNIGFSFGDGMYYVFE